MRTRVLASATVAIALPAALVWAAATIGGPLPSPLPLFPPDNWWNVDVSGAPLDASSAALITAIGPTRRMHPDFGPEAGPVDIYGIPYVVVDGSQAKKTVVFDYPRESDGVDHGTNQSFAFYPIPDEAITQPHWIEGGPPGNASVSGDRHMLIVDRDNKHLYELYALRYRSGRWEAGSGAFFDLTKNDRRPDTWTSADAAGLAILPGLVRHDEVYGPDEIGHAFRVTVHATNGYVFPASHDAGDTAGAPPLGTRLRLKAGKDLSGFPEPMQKIFRAMKKYGLIVADNGSDMYVSGTFDSQWDNDVLNPAFHSLTAADFEVVQRGWKPPANAVDLEVTQVESADPADVGLPLTYTLTARNRHPTHTATNVVVTDAPPPSFAFVSATTGCAFAAGKLTCALGTLPPAAQASVSLTMAPTLGGTFSNSASLTAAEPDEAPGDNVAAEAVTVHAAPTIAIGDATVTEGQSGTANAVFTVSLKAPFPVPLAVDYATASVTASPADFTPVSGTLVFPAGATSLPLPVAVQGDLLSEGNETFLVNLIGANYGVLSDPQGVGTIVDDDALPGLSVTGATVTEGDAGPVIALVTVSLSAPAGRPVKVAYATANGTAVAARDYLAASGTVVLPAGATEAHLAVAVVGDLVAEADESFTVNLKSPENATLAVSQSTVTVIDNDDLPGLAVGDVRITEGHVGTRNAAFRVSLSAASLTDVTVDWTTADATAKAGEDYLPSGGTLLIKKGVRAATLLVPVVGDRTDERNEVFLVRLTNPTGARLYDGLAQGVIWDDDGGADAYTPIASLPYAARAAGKYRLATDLETPQALGAAVTIAANGVTLDLDGHTLLGTAGAATEAFGILSRNRVGVTVSNGTVQGFLAGVFLAGPPPYAVAQRLTVSSLQARANTYAGVWLEGRGNAVSSTEVVGTGGSTALGPDGGAVGIASVGPAPKLTGNQVRDTMASGEGAAFGIAANGATSGVVSGNRVQNVAPAGVTGILVTTATKATVSTNTLDTLDYGIVFASKATGTCKANTVTAVVTPFLGVSCQP